MAADDRDRYRLQQRLEEVLGPEEASTLMTHLPPSRWDQVVTKDDLDARLDLLEERILRTLHETIATSLIAANRTTVLAITGSLTASTTISILVARFIP